MVHLSSEDSSEDEIEAERRGSRHVSFSTKQVPILDLVNPGNKRILLEGWVKKRSTLYIYRKRYLELSQKGNKIRLLYYDDSKKIRDETMLCS